jgi:hypothetical protein
MDNITTKIVGGKLIIEVDVSPAKITSAPFSKTGKSKLVASSHGFQSVNGNGLAISLNVTNR